MGNLLACGSTADLRSQFSLLGNLEERWSFGDKTEHSLEGGQFISGLWEQSAADEWNNGCNFRIQWHEDQREDKGRRR